jgi:hypothetical protein
VIPRRCPRCGEHMHSAFEPILTSPPCTIPHCVEKFLSRISHTFGQRYSSVLHNSCRRSLPVVSQHTPPTPCEQVAVKPFVEHIRTKYDATQSAAIEVCASLAASATQVSDFLRSSGGASAEPAVLPVVLIQGPPGTGKTHTVTVRCCLLARARKQFRLLACSLGRHLINSTQQFPTSLRPHIAAEMLVTFDLCFLPQICEQGSVSCGPAGLVSYACFGIPAHAHQPHPTLHPFFIADTPSTG